LSTRAQRISTRFARVALLCLIGACKIVSTHEARAESPQPLHSLNRPALRRVALAPSHDLVLLDVPAARARIESNDAFLQGMTPLDRQVRMASAAPVAQAQFLEHLGAQVRGFEPKQIDKISQVAALAGAALGTLDLLRFLPREIELVQTTGAEEGFSPTFDLSYTRSSVMYINTRGLQILSRQLLVHELFHVLCANRPELCARLYASIGFVPVGPPRLRDEFAERRLTLPENPSPMHALPVRRAGQRVLAVPLTFVPEPYAGGPMVEVSVSLWGVLGDRNDVTELVPLDELSGWREQLGTNTRMLASPDEILAENFVLLVLEQGKVASPFVLERMRAILR